MNAAALGLAVAFFITKLGALGHNIPMSLPGQDYLTGLVWALGLSLVLVCIPVSKEERTDLLKLWGLRCGVTLFAMLFYESHYGLDAYGYFEISKQLDYNWAQTGFGHGTENTEALSWLMNNFLPIFSSYHAMKVCYSFIGFLGCYIIYLGFARLSGNRNKVMLYLICAFPSMIFWSSILGKDPVILFGIALYVYGTLGIIRGKGPLQLIWIALGITLAGVFRSWYFMILIGPVASLGVNGIRKPVVKVFYLGLIVVATFYALQKFSAQFQVENMGDLVSRTQSISHSWGYGGSGMIAPQFASPAAMLKFAPIGMFTALFRPLPGEVMNPFGLFAGFENFFLLLFIFRNYKKFSLNRARFKEPACIWALSLILVWSFVYGFVSFQNLGAATRFRLQILPILLSFIFYLVEERSECDVRNRGTV